MGSEQKVIFLSDRLDALDEFRSEELRPVRPDGAISLADFHTGFSIEWYEALAVVQSVCRSIIDSADNGPGRVDPHDVLVSENGGIAVACKGPRNAVAAVQCLGTILDGLLPEHDFMFLRARLVSKATSSPPHYNSLQEFSDAIAYYERPNRAEIVQELYRRFRKLPAQPDAAPRIQQAAVPKREVHKERQREEDHVDGRQDVTTSSRTSSVRRALV